MKTVKKVKPAFKVDLTSAVTANDIYSAFCEAKVDAEVPIHTFELHACIFDALEMKDWADDILESILDCAATTALKMEELRMCQKHYCEKDEQPDAEQEAPKKKLPWYKKLWRKIFGKK